MVTDTAVNAVAFHTAQRKTRLNNSSINNVYVCQSTTRNQKQLHVALSSPVLCGNCLGMSDKSPLSKAELKKGLFCQCVCYYNVPNILVPCLQSYHAAEPPGILILVSDTVLP